MDHSFDFHKLVGILLKDLHVDKLIPAVLTGVPAGLFTGQLKKHFPFLLLYHSNILLTVPVSLI